MTDQHSAGEQEIRRAMENVVSASREGRQPVSEPNDKYVPAPDEWPDPAADLLAAEKKGFEAGTRQQREAAEELLATLPRFHDGHVIPRIELDVALVAIRTQPLVEWKP